MEVGTRVRVLSIRASVLSQVGARARRQIKSMQGEVLAVDEIDEYGSAWVTKWFQHRGGKATSHSLALNADEMEVVAHEGTNAA